MIATIEISASLIENVSGCRVSKLPHHYSQTVKLSGIAVGTRGYGYRRRGSPLDAELDLIVESLSYDYLRLILADNIVRLPTVGGSVASNDRK